MAKEFFLLKQEVLKMERPLFPNYNVLNSLLKALADTFRSHYAESPESSANIIDFLTKDPNTWAKQLLHQMETYHLHEAKELLKDYDGMFKMYNECIDQNWPHDAPAVPQLIISVNIFGNTITSHYFSKLTQMLECLNMKKAKRHKVELPIHHDLESSGYATGSTELTSELVEQEGSNATIELVHRSPSPLTLLHSSDGLD
ncbi:hypothetical protein PISMIDRAFT_19379 [Pisolithus microcarpus 441]|uniref:Uncharacterized protein n=1 Tax=Pisolithus microcarpus 441 TaxID=765257 RepID=A0A0C9YCL5_9AGAM|nr:hypothetical protein PISMIDRAFT_19379 [Pisolithus microcarpus 441]